MKLMFYLLKKSELFDVSEFPEFSLEVSFVNIDRYVAQMKCFRRWMNILKKI